MLTILLADDSATIRQVAEIIFKGETQYQLVTAVDGNDALAKATAQKPDLVLADHNMPGKDGYELAAALRPMGVKVMMLTGSSKAFDENRAHAAGVIGNLDKPFDTFTLLNNVAQATGAVAPDAPPGLRPVGSAPITRATPPATPPSAAVTPTPLVATPIAAPQVAATPVAPVSPQPPSTSPFAAPQRSEPASQVDVAVAKVTEQAAPQIAAAQNGGQSAPSAEAISQNAREIIERVVWEVVPEMAEALIKEEIARILGRAQS